MITASPLQPLPVCPIIFLADDDSDDCMLFTDALKQVAPNAILNCVPTCERLIEQLETANPLPNLIFLDINIPVMGGLKCLMLIKNHYRFTTIPVVMYSTSNHPADVTTAYKAGASRYFSKSSTFNHLTSNLHTILANYTQWPRKINSNDFLIGGKKTVPSWSN